MWLEVDGKMGKWGGGRKKQLATFRDAEQQLRIRNTDEKSVQRKCQTSKLKFIFGNHPRNGMESGSSEENPSRSRDLPNGLSEFQMKEERK